MRKSMKKLSKKLKKVKNFQIKKKFSIKSTLREMGVKYPLRLEFRKLKSLYSLALYHEWHAKTFPKGGFDYDKIRDDLYKLSHLSPSEAANQLKDWYGQDQYQLRETDKNQEYKAGSRHWYRLEQYHPQKREAQEIETEELTPETTASIEAIVKTVSEDIDALEIEEEIFEGKKTSRYVNYYERNTRLRAEAILIHGTKCMGCGFDFEAKYGHRGSGYIEVHHVVPVSFFIAESKVDPKHDLIVLCSNCHRMVHRRRDKVLNLSELRNLIIHYSGSILT
jgi:hypothetical protein